MTKIPFAASQLNDTDWNDAVKANNTRRAQIKGEIVARVSAYFGFDLPVTFPYYQGSNAGKPVHNPLATNNSFPEFPVRRQF